MQKEKSTEDISYGSMIVTYHHRKNANPPKKSEKSKRRIPFDTQGNTYGPGKQPPTTHVRRELGLPRKGCEEEATEKVGRWSNQDRLRRWRRLRR